MEKKYCVYKHTTPNGKIYIGITSQPSKQRFRNGHGYDHNEHFKRAIMLYGWQNIQHDILATGMGRETAIYEEKRLIALYDSTNFKKGYNLMTGGDGIGTHTESTKEKLRMLNLGKKQPVEQVERHRQRMIGRRHSQKTKDVLSEKRIGEKNPFYGKRHSEQSKALIKEHCADFNGGKSVNAKRVIQLNINGEIINEYDAISTAGKINNFTNPYNISACCKGKLKTAYGHIWRYAEEVKI